MVLPEKGREGEVMVEGASAVAATVASQAEVALATAMAASRAGRREVVQRVEAT